MKSEGKTEYRFQKNIRELLNSAAM